MSLDLEAIAATIRLHDEKPPIAEWDRCDGCHIESVRALSAALEAVREIHKSSDGKWCDGCEFGWPCETTRALEASLTPLGGGGHRDRQKEKQR